MNNTTTIVFNYNIKHVRELDNLCKLSKLNLKQTEGPFQSLQSLKVESELCLGDDGGSDTGAQSAPPEGLQVFVSVRCSGLLTRPQLYFCAA